MHAGGMAMTSSGLPALPVSDNRTVASQHSDEILSELCRMRRRPDSC